MTTAHQAALNTLRQAGFFIVAWTPKEINGLNDVDLKCLEDMLITKGNDFIQENQPPEEIECPHCGRTLEADQVDDGVCNSDDCPGNDEPGICPTCSGSGEGMYEGTRCSSCKGRGEA